MNKIWFNYIIDESDFIFVILLKKKAVATCFCVFYIEAHKCYFSLSQGNSLERRSLLSSLSSLGLQDPRKRAPCACVKQCKPCVKGFTGFLRKPRNISLFLSLFYFLIVDSGPPCSGPLKDLNIGERVSPF